MFSLKTLVIRVSNSFRCLSVNVCFKGYPPMFLDRNRPVLYNCLMNSEFTFQVHICYVTCSQVGLPAPINTLNPSLNASTSRA